ncbi:STAS domain-containing protein [Deinococcus malanensis]|uniref:STAS domain-containing protein n=1 Tax=Deinococcus malanensis TaxID=1706855 RepID=UPI00363E2E85
MTQDSTALLDHWLTTQLNAPTLRRDLVSESTLRKESQAFLAALGPAVASGQVSNIHASEWEGVRAVLDALSESRAQQGFTPGEVATFVLSFKQPLFEQLRVAIGNADQLVGELWNATTLLDQLGLYTIEVYQRSREAIIERQRQEMLELSTPVVKLWEGVVALPLIGTLDSERTQVVMETLLERIIETGSTLAIIDITGVPTVDTLVAQHLLRTVSAAQLMGADCIISGIRPQIAQTIVHLGIDLAGVTTKATLADALQVALARRGYSVARASRN